MKIIPAITCAIFLTHSTGAFAQVDTSAYQRLQELSATDPELFQLIMLTLSSNSRDVEGGFNWEPSDASLDCEEGYDGGLTECEVTLAISGQSFAASEDRRNATLEIECDAELNIGREDGFVTTEREREQGELMFFSGSWASTDISMDFSFLGSSRVVRAEIGNVSCDLLGVR